MTRTCHPDAEFPVRLVLGHDVVLGPGKVDLLEAIDRTGSITAAAREMALSYKKAWRLIYTMDAHSAEPVVETVSGGRGKGDRLTAVGRTVVDHYRRLQERLKLTPGQ